jgi:WD40 repeat protein
VWSAAFSPDGTRVVTASGDHTARVWDAATGKPLSSPLEHDDTVWTAAFSRDGKLIVTASNDHTARIWDAETGEPLSPPLEHDDTVWSAAFSPDGTSIVTASGDGFARIWLLPIAPETLEEWQAITDRASPYILANGVLSPRSAAGDRV